jgi:hypothetical protein
VEHHSESGFSCLMDDDCAVLSAPGLSLSFKRSGDRWCHCLESTHGKRVLHVARSDDLTVGENERQIASPVYQEVHRHELADGLGLCLLLTGRLFQHHFSAAVTLRKDPEQPGFLELDFDVADRCRAPIESLAATYLVGLDSGALIDAVPGRIAWSAVQSGLDRIELCVEPPSSLVLAEAGRQAMRAQVLAAIVPATFTHRLRYRWRWAPSTDRT